MSDLYGFTSLAVLAGVGGVAAGWDWADPMTRLVIMVAILAVLRQAAREISRWLMDAVDPALVDQAEQIVRAAPGVLGVGQVRLRWIGHRLRAECEVIVDAETSTVGAHWVTVSVEHGLCCTRCRACPPPWSMLTPRPRDGADYHAELMSHR